MYLEAMPLDLSFVHTGDPDEGQKNHGDLPHEAKMHLAMAFAAHAGLAKSPGEYKGPAVKPPTDWEDPQDEEGQRNVIQESEALQNTADMGNPPVIPSYAPAKAAKTPIAPPSDKPDFSTL
jgi:hypothetical protein